MTEANGNPQTDPAAVSKPRVVITFGGPGLAEMAITHDPGVTDGQLFAAAWLLDQYAREMRAAIMLRQVQGQLVVPQGLPAGIRPPRQ